MSTLALLQESMAAFLAGQGVTALPAWPKGERQARTAPVAVVKVKEVAAEAAGFQGYLGDRFDETSQRWAEVLGQRVTVTFALDLYSPQNRGEEGCRQLLDQVAAALQTGGPTGLTVERWTMGETAFQGASGMFVGTLRVLCRGLLTAQTDTDGVFLGFEVKGGVQVCLQ